MQMKNCAHCTPPPSIWGNKSPLQNMFFDLMCLVPLRLLQVKFQNIWWDVGSWHSHQSEKNCLLCKIFWFLSDARHFAQTDLRLRCTSTFGTSCITKLDIGYRSSGFFVPINIQAMRSITGLLSLLVKCIIEHKNSCPILHCKFFTCNPINFYGECKGVWNLLAP